MTGTALARGLRLVVIGCSAGGFEALGKIFEALPKRLQIPMVVVIHQSPDLRSTLAELLSGMYRLPIKEAEDKELIQPGFIYLPASDYHLSIERDFTFCLSQEDRINYSRPSIDVLFESAAIAYREQVLGIVLTGANSDGARGLKQMIELGGKGIVQNPKTAQFPVMPEAALTAKPHAVMELDQIAEWLKQLQLPRDQRGL